VSSSTFDATIKMWRVVDVDVLRNLDSLPADRELFQSGALELVQGAPVYIDHRKDRRIGVIRELSEFADTDGTWLFAHTTITDPPDWLKRGTAASMSYATAQRRSLGPAHERVLRGLVTEVSVLSPGVLPEETRAKVVLYRQAAEAISGEVFYGNGQVLIRPGVGQVLGIH
jgi:hypothetical protein